MSMSKLGRWRVGDTPGPWCQTGYRSGDLKSGLAGHVGGSGARLALNAQARLAAGWPRAGAERRGRELASTSSRRRVAREERQRDARALPRRAAARLSAHGSQRLGSAGEEASPWQLVRLGLSAFLFALQTAQGEGFFQIVEGRRAAGYGAANAQLRRAAQAGLASGQRSPGSHWFMRQGSKRW
jgi:hypothetical protein